MLKVKKVTSYYHASELFGIARRAAAGAKPYDEGFLVAILFSVLALEAFINESGDIAEMVPTLHRQKIVEGFSAVMSELEDRKESLLIKYHMALLVFSGSTWDEGSQPFQDFKLLVSLRNALAHTKADKWEAMVSDSKPDPLRKLDQYPKLVQQLCQKRLIEEPATSVSWLEVMATQKVANWACLTAESVTKAFLHAVPDGYYKSSLAKHIFHATDT